MALDLAYKLMDLFPKQEGLIDKIAAQSIVEKYQKLKEYFDDNKEKLNQKTTGLFMRIFRFFSEFFVKANAKTGNEIREVLDNSSVLRVVANEENMKENSLNNEKIIITAVITFLQEMTKESASNTWGNTLTQYLSNSITIQTKNPIVNEIAESIRTFCENQKMKEEQHPISLKSTVQLWLWVTKLDAAINLSDSEKESISNIRKKVNLDEVPNPRSVKYIIDLAEINGLTAGSTDKVKVVYHPQQYNLIQQPNEFQLIQNLTVGPFGVELNIKGENTKELVSYG